MNAYEFWHGSPLLLNITIIISLTVIILILLVKYCGWWCSRKENKKTKASRNYISSQNKDFNPKDDKDPTRPLAILKFPKDPKNEKSDLVIAGNMDLLMQLPHVTQEVVFALQDFDTVDIFADDRR